MADLVQPGEELVVAQGGRGGRGNMALQDLHQPGPAVAEPGEPGEERRLALELKLIADVGLVGMPNAGKSTLLGAISRGPAEDRRLPVHHARAASSASSSSSATDAIVVADIPGLIEGAQHGARPRPRFLRHIERTRVLVHLVDGSSEDRWPTVP